MTVTFHLRPDLQALIMPEPLSMTTGWLAMTLAHRLLRLPEPSLELPAAAAADDFSEPGLFIFAIHGSELCRHIHSTSAVFEAKLWLHLDWYVAATRAFVKKCIPYHVRSLQGDNKTCQQ